MKMNNLKENNFREIIKYAVVILALVIITVILLEIPRQYYAWDEERMQNEVTVKTYAAVNTVSGDMSLNQKIGALADDNTIVTDGKKGVFTFDEKIDIKRNLLAVINEKDINMAYGWDDILNYVMNSDVAWRGWTSFQIIQVIDSDIYCFDVGIMCFQATSDSYGWIMFDMETCKILYARAYNGMGYDEMEEFGYIYDEVTGSYYESEYAYENYMICQENYVNSLERYYGVKLSVDNCEAMVNRNYLCISPFTANKMNSKVMTRISESLSKELPGVFY